METRKVLIAEHSLEYCGGLAQILGDRFQVSTCQDGITALTQLEMFRPHVLVLDLSLPELDGLSVLRRAVTHSPRPKCLVTSTYISDYVQNAVDTLGVDLVILKPCDAHALADRIGELAGVEEISPLPLPSMSISNILLDLNILTTRNGFRYLEEAIWMYHQNPGISMTKELYPAIGRRHHCSANSVERAIRGSIHEAWNIREDRVWITYFSSGRNGTVLRPSNSVFIATLSEHLRSKQAP